MIENPPIFLLDHDVIADVSPVKDTGGTLEASLISDLALVLFEHSNRSGRHSLGVIFAFRNSRDVATSEHQHFSFGLLGCNQLSGSKVDEMIENGESDDDADVSPLVRSKVAILRADVRSPLDNTFPSNRANSNAGTVLRGKILVPLDHGREECVTIEGAAVKFVHHERFEAVCDGVEVVDPAAPAEHVLNRYNEAGEDDEREQNENTRN